MCKPQKNINISFLELLDEVQNEISVQIPIIQRDYVQGRATDQEQKERRTDFVKKLLNALLKNGTEYTLDFIYGSHETGLQKAPFLPLDGQQRLTTLFLLHWVLLQKDNNVTSQYDKEKVKNLLKRFSYKTRISSDRFIKKILDDSTFRQITDDLSLTERINNQSWYDNNMRCDPTVQAMVMMIEAIEKILCEKKYKDEISSMANNLFNSNRINFDRLDIEKYDLTDALYVNMNARGKELTTFENFKADFLKFLEIKCDNAKVEFTNHTDRQNYYYDSYKSYFSNSIEHEWMDLFWPQLLEKYRTSYRTYLEKLSNGEKVLPPKYPLMDESFMNFFYNVLRLYYSDKNYSDKKLQQTDEKNEEKIEIKTRVIRESVFGTTDSNGKFTYLNSFIEMLDWLQHIEKTIKLDVFFNDLFNTDDNTNSLLVYPYDDKGNNLFERTCQTEDEVATHILLLAIVKYCTKYNQFRITENLKKYVRICRNYLKSQNQFDTYHVLLQPNIRQGKMNTYNLFFNKLAEKEDPYESLKEMQDCSEYYKLSYYNDANTQKIIRKIEDLPFTQGCLYAFTPILDACKHNTLNPDSVETAIKAFEKADDITRVQLLIAYDYKGKEIGNPCSYGKRLFFGSRVDSTDRWEGIFQHKDSISTLQKALYDYVKDWQEGSKQRVPFDIKKIINKKFEDIIDPSKNMFKYYMLKYPDAITANLKDKPYYYFAVNDANKLNEEYDMIAIHSYSRHPLGNSKQVEPLAFVVMKRLFENKIPKKSLECEGTGGVKSGVRFIEANGNKLFHLKFAKHHWYIIEGRDLLKDDFVMNRLINENKYSEDRTNYYLNNLEDKDLVETAVAFMTEVYKYFTSLSIIRN